MLPVLTADNRKNVLKINFFLPQSNIIGQEVKTFSELRLMIQYVC